MELSRLLKRESPDPSMRRRLVVAAAAWFRWGPKLGREATPRDGLRLAMDLETLAAGPKGPAGALAELKRHHRGLERAADALPDWIRAGLPKGVDPEALALAMLRPPSLWLRAVDGRRLRGALGPMASGLVAHEHLPDAYRLETNVDLYGTEAFRLGLFVLQDPASQAIGAVCRARAGEHWLDLCAGAGGKTLQLAQAMGAKGMVHAFDVHEGRLEELRRRAKRQQVFNLRVLRWDGRVLPATPPQDGALVDAPCSNSGTLRRNPDLWNRSSPDMAAMTTLQDSLLDRAAERLKPGGRLVYATCSLLVAENEERVEAFLKRWPDFACEGFESPLNGQAVPSGRLRVSPLHGDRDGTFMALLRRKA